MEGVLPMARGKGYCVEIGKRQPLRLHSFVCGVKNTPPLEKHKGKLLRAFGLRVLD